VLSGLSAEPWSGGAKRKEDAMRTSQKTSETISTIGIDVGKNTFHLVALDKRGAIALRSRMTNKRRDYGAGPNSCANLQRSLRNSLLDARRALMLPLVS
jgi:hypothetical protein